MYLKRIYNEEDLLRYKTEREETNKAWRAKLESIGIPPVLVDTFAKQISSHFTKLPVIEALSLDHTGTKPEQNFSVKLVIDLLKNGLVEIKDNTLILHAQPEDLIYQIKRRPGRYCLHCGEKLQDDEKGELARLHVAEKHPGVPSPDPNNPSGYVAQNYFECVLDSDQHDKFKVKKSAVAPSLSKGGF